MRDGDVGYICVLPEGEAVADSLTGEHRVVRAVHAIEAPFAASVSGPVATLVDSQDAIAELLPVGGGRDRGGDARCCCSC